MSLGEIDTKFHLDNNIKFIPLVNSTNYLFYILGILTGKNKIHKNIITAKIDTGSTFSYFPKNLFKSFYAQFEQLCLDKKGNNLCGNFKFENDLGYCSTFKDKDTLLKTVKENWPTITFELYKNRLYIWNPLNYYYYDNKANKPRACLGFLHYNQDSITLGQNFIHGHDVIFDLKKNIFGFVPADCSRGNKNTKEEKKIENISPEIKKDKIEPAPVKRQTNNDINNNKKVENINKDNIDKKEEVHFIRGKNKELEIVSGPKLINFIIILIFGIIIVIALLIIIIILICKNKEYQKYRNLNNNIDEIKKLNIEQNIANEESNNIHENKDNEINNNIQETDNNNNEDSKEDENKKEKEKEKKKSIVESNLDEIQYLKKMMKKK